MRQLTTNQRYGGYNARFEKRAALLRRFGFAYTAHDGIAYFVRRTYGKNYSVAAAYLSFADNVAWFDKLRDILRK